MKTKQLIAAALVGAIGLSPQAFAGGKDSQKNEVTAAKAALADAAIDLPQAIAAAEAHVQGTAVAAELADEKGQSAYEIEVLKGDQLIEVIVDSRDGKILSAKADHEGNREYDGDRKDAD